MLCNTVHLLNCSFQVLYFIISISWHHLEIIFDGLTLGNDLYLDFESRTNFPPRRKSQFNEEIFMKFVACVGFGPKKLCDYMTIWLWILDEMISFRSWHFIMLYEYCIMQHTQFSTNRPMVSGLPFFSTIFLALYGVLSNLFQTGLRPS